MKAIILFTLFTFFLSLVGTVNPPPRSVILALETSLLFEPEHLNDNIKTIKNARDFLEKLQAILATHAREERSKREPSIVERRSSFGDFFKDIGQKISDFTNKHSQKVSEVLHKEVISPIKNAIDDTKKEHGYRADDNKGIVREIIQHWMKPDHGASKLSFMRTAHDYERLIHNFGKTMDKYYSEEDVKKLQLKFNKFIRHIEDNKDPSKVVREMIQFGVSDKVNTLNKTLLVDYVNDMKLLIEFIKQKMYEHTLKVEDKNKMARRSNPETTSSNTQNVVPSDSIERNEVYDQLKKALGEKLKRAKEKIKEMGDAGGLTNEVIIDSVELFVERKYNTA